MMEIQTEGIKKDFNGEPCLKGISLSIEKGSFVTLMGASGSGKTTLLEILAGIRRPDEGSVVVRSKKLFGMTEKEKALFRRTEMGVVYQNFSLISTLTALDNITLPLILNKNSEHAREKAYDIAERLNLPFTAMKKFPEELSGGQQQRVAIARALVYNPPVLFLDEPTSSLDTLNTYNVLCLLKEINKEYGTTILHITHSVKLAEAVSEKDNIIKISDGVLQI